MCAELHAAGGGEDRRIHLAVIIRDAPSADSALGECQVQGSRSALISAIPERGPAAWEECGRPGGFAVAGEGGAEGMHGVSATRLMQRADRRIMSLVCKMRLSGRMSWAKLA
jgi:hypothetical protein